MQYRKKLVNRTVHHHGAETNFTDERFKELMMEAFKTRTGYPGYLTSNDVRAHLFMGSKALPNSPTATVEFVVSKFDPEDMSVEITITEHRVELLTRVHGKPIEEIDILTAWFIKDNPSNWAEVTAFHFASYLNPNSPEVGEDTTATCLE